jgi:hypothetical protein
MNRILLFFTAYLFVTTLYAQAPYKMSYQAVIRDENGDLVVSTQIGMKISILQGSENGPAVYSESQSPSSNTNGLVSLEIGGGMLISGDFAAINWANGPFFINTEIDLRGGSNYTLSGVSQLLSVPYALHAKTSDTDNEHFIGELFGGGIIVAVWKENGHETGLIASLTDISQSAQYSSIPGMLIGAEAQSPNNGQTNTNAIVTQGDISGAAHLCQNYEAGGFSDWYLPSAWELNQCYNAAFIVNSVLGPANGFHFASYWSSTEVNYFNAVSFHFNLGFMNANTKVNDFRVRAVRRF